MPFHEKSAWIMFATLLTGGFVYFFTVVSTWFKSGQLASPVIPQILTYTCCLVVIVIAGHIVTAALAPKDTNAPVDERDKQIITRAGYYSSYAIVVGILISLGLYLLSDSGDLLFYTVFASLLAGHIVEYFVQILFYRTTI